MASTYTVPLIQTVTNVTSTALLDAAIKTAIELLLTPGTVVPGSVSVSPTSTFLNGAVLTYMATIFYSKKEDL